MSMTKEKRREIRQYLLDKIDQGQSSAVRKTAEAFGVTPATVYHYLDAMENEGVLRKIKRGTYELLSQTRSFILRRSAGELDSEMTVYDRYIADSLKDLPDNVRGIWDYICGEMINNVIDHSGAEHLEIRISRNALHTSVCLKDYGVGIFAKIKAHFGFATMEETIGELFKGKLTTDTQHHSGEGIFFSSRLADRFMILSDGNVFTHERFDGDGFRELLHTADLEEDYMATGTTVYMVLANNSLKRAKDVFDLYADVDSGFTRTRIPLSNYFERSPVSRSQAKNLCGRLEQFEEVELDFDGLEWMGQGFAHQLFVVFRNDHPSVRLIPVNMNDDVRKMYRHVIKAIE